MAAEERLQAYVELLSILTLLTDTFSVGLNVSRFNPNAEQQGHDSELVSQRWDDLLERQRLAEVRVGILSDRFSKLYEREDNPLMYDLFMAQEYPNITAVQWAELGDRVTTLIDFLKHTARED